jgi:hypothetical protein
MSGTIGIRSAFRMVMASPSVMENDNMQASSTTAHEANRVLGAQMAQLGVRLLNKYGQVLQCEYCGATWTPQLGHDGTYPRGFSRCPNRCNW